ncbi:peptidase S8/S53 domain-containing protein [Catenaria anguillulae PL171]|uniref:Peptidase S8/S53 domain-containing protein n=1 Tax=Catenaria anguillulae PL171 TaxID=765915 RepID=A0A1Y2HS33_9FUNG|nr:peptidase S8/S53 domain-containing protein [Catenaria anguillulae PL171]
MYSTNNPRTSRRRSSGVVTLLALAAVFQVALAAPASTDKWIVELDNVQEEQQAQAIFAAYKAQGKTTFSAGDGEIIRVGKWAAMTFPAGDDAFKAELLKLGPVRAVEREQTWGITGRQANPPAGLDRLDSRNGLDQAFNFPDNGGSGVDVYVIDTGVTTQHPDFGNRAQTSDVTGEGATDANGHGTHVAGTIAGQTFGIAKAANIIGIKVFGASGRGSNGAILRALQQVSQSVQQRRRPSVVNMSLGGPRGNPNGRSATENAIEQLVQQGVAVVVAAGNESQDACQVSPAFIPNAITVGAIDPRNDQIASFSNFGRCVDLFGPGVRTESASNAGRGSRILSGTSMATPHVAGVMAVLMGQGLNLQQATQRLLETATPGVVRGNIRGSPNRLLFLDSAGAGAQRPPANGGGRNQRDGEQPPQQPQPPAQPPQQPAPPANPPQNPGTPDQNQPPKQPTPLSAVATTVTARAARCVVVAATVVVVTVKDKAKESAPTTLAVGQNGNGAARPPCDQAKKAKAGGVTSVTSA